MGKLLCRTLGRFLAALPSTRPAEMDSTLAQITSRLRRGPIIAVLREGEMVQLGSGSELAATESETFAQMISTAAI